MKEIKKTVLILKTITLYLTISLIVGCPTAPEIPVGSISGTIHLENQTDHSGITVAVYNFAELDVTIKNINEEYPHIGVIINQQTQFDHRFQSPLKYVETNGNGNFQINDISTGIYNIVALKDSFGFKYIYNVQVSEGSNTIDSLSLYPETNFEGSIFDDMIFEKNHHYIIDDDTEFFNTYIEIQPNSVIRISPEKSLKLVFCEVKIQGKQDSLFWITCNDGFTESLTRLTVNNISPFNNFELSENSSVINSSIEWGKFDFANICFLNETDSLSISDCIFRESLAGFYSSDSNFELTTNCSNILSYNIISEGYGGIYYLGVNQGTIEKSIFCSNHNGVKIKDKFEGEVRNNYFANNTNGIYLWHFIGEIVHNELINNFDYDIKLNGNFGTETEGFVIHYNNFNSDIGISQYITSHYHFLREVYINNNNFRNENMFIEYISSQLYGILDATNNYFNGLVTEMEIKQKIIDKFDNDVNEIIVVPFEINLISDAGIE